MPTNTYVALDKITVGTATASVTFSSISSAYTDLVLVFNGANTVTGPNDAWFQVGNGSVDTATNYSRTFMYGNGTSAISSRGSTESVLYLAGYFGTGNSTVITNFMNYSNTTTNKTVLVRSSTDTNVYAGVGLWRSTVAINTIKVSTAGGNFAVGSTFSLYGIKTANAGLAKATGGTITYDGNGNVIHTFTSSGTFTPLESLTCEYLVVGGGGGGGRYIAGGGGGGGYRSSISGESSGGGASAESPLTVSSGVGLTVTIGAGGAGAPTGGDKGTVGANSVFSSITANGGGYGGGGNSGTNYAGGTGGSGGGGYFDTTTAGGSGTANQGYAGGTAGTLASGGGGGAGSVGVTPSSSGVGGNGGSGIASSVTGLSVTRAGGGGGAGTGTNGSGTGGGGSAANTGVAGTANTGGGGGGGGQSSPYSGGTGGSGIVIIRYAG